MDSGDIGVGGIVFIVGGVLACCGLLGLAVHLGIYGDQGDEDDDMRSFIERSGRKEIELVNNAKEKARSYSYDPAFDSFTDMGRSSGKDFPAHWGQVGARTSSNIG